ncbi:septum formation inhibitor Maf [bacterium SCSIO 12696]|nr:septum formation inhibitor Maf [bacterium SCSIO 12696]
MSQLPPDFILASASPRRRELLQQVGACFQVVAANVPEQRLPGEAPEDYVTRLALAKARAGFAAQDGAALPVLGSDTTVVYGDQVLGKPRNREHGIDMLSMLSGSTHRVLSGVAMVAAGKESLRLVETLVTFRTLSNLQCQQYWQTGEPADKAGGYGIQGLAAVFVKRIKGSYSNVVGLPLAETADLLAEFGIAVWKGT